MPSLTGVLFRRFTASENERRYRREQRQAQVKFIRALMLIGPAMLTSYVVINPLFVEAKFGLGMLLASVAMLPLLGFYYWYVGQPGYARSRWIDAGFFLAIEPLQFLFILVLWRSGVSGWPFYAIICYNQLLLLTYACLAFAASVREFFVWTLVTIAYVAAAMVVLGVPPGVGFYTWLFYAPFALLLFYLNWAIDDKSRLLFDSGIKLDAEKQKSDALLYNVLPQSIAERLQSGEAIADAFDDVTIIFVDVVGFTRMSQSMPATELVKLLNAFFSRADRGCDLFRLEKVKTIGDAYMAVAGAIVPVPRPAKAAIDFAHYLIAAAHDLSREFALDFQLHIGINSGPVIGGVISSKRMSYDYWGDAINFAARLEGAAAANGVTVSQSTYDATCDSYRFLPPRMVPLKGIGEVPIYDLDLPAGA
jgi:adenylate cyclase